MFFSVWSHSLPVCCIVPYWLKLDVLVMGWRNPCQWTFMGESPPFLTLSKVRLIYIFQTCSFLLRNGFSWSVGAGSLSACYHSAGTAQPSSQMAVFHRNKTYELNFISLSGLWYVESPRFISTLIPTPVYCFGSLMHEGGFRNWNLPGIYNCMFYSLLELQALFSLPPLFFLLSLPLTHTQVFPKNFITKGSHMHWNTAGKQGSCSPILNFPCLCAILIVCHFCLQPRLCVLQIKPMETWKVEHCPHFHQEIAYLALPWLPQACVTYLIKVALVSPLHCPIWALG